MSTSFRSFDFVVVGAGPSAMGLLYGLLEPFKDATTPSFSIAIIERGSGPPHDSMTQSPGQWYEAAHKIGSNSVLLIPSAITGRSMDIPVGRGLGGTSNVNACLCTQPLAQDFDTWPGQWKNKLLQSLKSLEDTLEENQAIHFGIKNMEGVSSPYSKKGAIEFTAKVPTLVSKDSLGRLVRKNYYDALLEPLLTRYPHLKENLSWFRGMEAQRLLLQQRRIIGVQCWNTSDDTIWELHATQQVVLCTGAIETPALLLISGIGKDKNLAGIGRHLKDQVCLARTYITLPQRKNRQLSTNGVAALGRLSIGENTFQIAIVDGTCHASILPSALAMVFRRRWNVLVYPALWHRMSERIYRILKAILKVVISFIPLKHFLSQYTTTTLLFLMSPRSEGYVDIDQTNHVSDDVPLMRKNVDVRIDTGYLHDARDINALRLGWETCGRMARDLEIFPNCFYRESSNFYFDWFQLYCKLFCLPYFHWCGTCMIKTKSNSDWVVDTELRLRDHEGLSICDASVIPTMLSCPPALTCAALGYAFSEKLSPRNETMDRPT